MDNKVNLTDDELSLIVTSLQMTIMSNERHIQQNGESGLDFETKEVIIGMKQLYKRLSSEYF